MEAGRELDYRIAIRVMRLNGVRPDKGGEIVYDKPMFDYVDTYAPVPNYSTRIQDAWLVVENFQDAEIEYAFGGHTRVLLHKSGAGWFSAFADTAPLAICLAALMAVE